MKVCTCESVRVKIRVVIYIYIHNVCVCLSFYVCLLKYMSIHDCEKMYITIYVCGLFAVRHNKFTCNYLEHHN